MSLSIINPSISEYQHELALRIQRHTPSDGVHPSAVPSLFFRRSSYMLEPRHSINVPSLCIIVQGSKTATVGTESYTYDPASYLVTPVHLPVIGKITEASPQVPYLSLQLNFTPEIILDIVKGNPPQWDGTTGRGIIVSKSTPPLLDAVLRLVKLEDTPGDIPILAPLITREVLYRVLQGEQGASITQFAFIGSHAYRISEAIQLINRDYAKPLLIEELAKEVNLSPSALHKHFKKVTAMSPLQYQKAIRLQVARRLLLTEFLDAADAGYRVGYESPSQFSREYARMFGLPPISDVKHMRDSINDPVT
ncbi:AraC family transcriptional regulator [Paenibacillus jilunlii]|uniref:AraC family transcriptional regulator n=1 Tax=Paenibacillus jilunlii TaxID=682956 RepID=A0A1G9IQ81_9BACL|nr:AraC family transcriptional regulator [Paenibacillus jilunlii]KWX72736.1 AraC family transcriptional regulator [Paenibacillus jilunlii]SDL27439.1 transcriptional regulator, AraC family [Paenibacillus jilunlii]